MKFVKATLKDLTQINDIHNKIFPLDPLTNLVQELQSNNDVYYLAIDEEVMGYISFKCVIDECDMMYFAIDQDYQNQKIGQKLLNYAINELKQSRIKVITLEVRESNISAISVYKKLGFKNVSIRKKYYTDPIEDGLVYRWESEVL